MQPSRTCLVPFHQPSLWKLASSSPPLFFLTSSLPFAGEEAIGEGGGGRGGGGLGEVGRAGEGEVESPTPSCQRRSEETSGAICCAFQLPLLALAHSPSLLVSPVC